MREDEDNTYQSCAAWCNTYFGLNYIGLSETECYCATSRAELGEDGLEEKDCDQKCPGDDKEDCGANDAITTFDITACPVNGEVETDQCDASVPGGEWVACRALSEDNCADSADQLDGNTIALCAAHCAQSAANKNFAVQGSQCFCSKKDDFCEGTAEIEHCHMTDCPGHDGNWCGGYDPATFDPDKPDKTEWSIAVYTIVDQDICVKACQVPSEKGGTLSVEPGTEVAVGETVTLTCPAETTLADFRTEPNDEMVCTQQGFDSNYRISCQPHCAHEEVVNGTLDFGADNLLPYRQSVDATCFHPNALDGKATVTCGRGGKLSKVPKCQPPCNPAEIAAAVTASVMEPAAYPVLYKKEVTVTCEGLPNYTLDPVIGDTFKCDKGGEWKEFPVCHPPYNASSLDPLPSTVYTPADGDVLYQEAVKISCTDSYTLVGAPDIVCLANGTFGAQGVCVPPCNVSSLPVLPATAYDPPGGLVPYQQSVTMSCTDSYKLVGSNLKAPDSTMLECGREGVWLVDLTNECVQPCNATSLPSKPGVAFDPSEGLIVHQDIVTVSCSYPYIPSNSSWSPTLECLLSGEFEVLAGSPCLAPCDVGTLPPLAHGSYDDSGLLAVGEALGASCDFPYELQGNAELRCQADQTFPEPPSCVLPAGATSVIVPPSTTSAAEASSSPASSSTEATSSTQGSSSTEERSSAGISSTLAGEATTAALATSAMAEVFTTAMGTAGSSEDRTSPWASESTAEMAITRLASTETPVDQSSPAMGLQTWTWAADETAAPTVEPATAGRDETRAPTSAPSAAASERPPTTHAAIGTTAQGFQSTIGQPSIYSTPGAPIVAPTSASRISTAPIFPTAFIFPPVVGTTSEPVALTDTVPALPLDATTIHPASGTTAVNQAIGTIVVSPATTTAVREVEATTDTNAQDVLTTAEAKYDSTLAASTTSSETNPKGTTTLADLSLLTRSQRNEETSTTLDAGTWTVSLPSGASAESPTAMATEQVSTDSVTTTITPSTTFIHRQATSAASLASSSETVQVSTEHSSAYTTPATSAPGPLAETKSNLMETRPTTDGLGRASSVATSTIERQNTSQDTTAIIPSARMASSAVNDARTSRETATSRGTVTASNDMDALKTITAKIATSTSRTARKETESLPGEQSTLLDSAPSSQSTTTLKFDTKRSTSAVPKGQDLTTSEAMTSVVSVNVESTPRETTSATAETDYADPTSSKSKTIDIEAASRATKTTWPASSVTADAGISASSVSAVADPASSVERTTSTAQPSDTTSAERDSQPPAAQTSPDRPGSAALMNEPTTTTKSTSRLQKDSLPTAGKTTFFHTRVPRK